MSELNPKPYKSAHKGVHWRNKHFNVAEQPELYYEARNLTSNRKVPQQNFTSYGLNSLRQCVLDAEKNHKSVTAVGGRWSLSRVATNKDYMVNTFTLSAYGIGYSEASLDPQFLATQSDQRGNLVYAQCGMSVFDLNKVLEAKGLSLPTTGASNGQSFCGAISTGTHGSAIEVGSMQDYVVALHIIGEKGKHFWLERASEPIVSQAYIQKKDTSLIRDDDMFNSALVSFGSFGLIHALVIKAVPLFGLDIQRKQMDWPKIKTFLKTMKPNQLDFSALTMFKKMDQMPFHFEVTINPFKMGDNDKGAYVTVMHKSTTIPAPPHEQDYEIGLGIGSDLLGNIGAITDSLPSILSRHFMKLAVGTLSSRVFPKDYTKQGTPGVIFSSLDYDGKGMSTELGIALDDIEKTMDIIQKVADDHGFPGLIGMRFVKKSKALLAFTKFDITCTIELPGAYSDHTQEFYNLMFQELDKEELNYTLHWGQYNSMLNLTKIKKMWGDSTVDLWLQKRREFLPGSGRKTFANAFLRKCGLAD